MEREVSVRLRAAGAYAAAVGKWLAVSMLVGVLCGVVGAAFHTSVHIAAELRAEWPWLLWGLPAAGLAIVGFYKLTKTESLGTNDVFDAVNRDGTLPILLAPAIFLGTVLTHLCGGSAGREGAALQIGGSIGQQTGRILRLDRPDLRVATLCGMAGCFSALFGTPLTAAVFAIMVVSVDALYHAALLPCLLSALTAFRVALVMGVEPTRYTVSVPAATAVCFLKTAALAALCAAVSVLFCTVIHTLERWMHRHIPNPWLRVSVGGAAVIAMTCLAGSQDYNGAGMEIIAAAVEEGTVHPAAFYLKLLFTAVTLAAGFKGGEVVPSFFVGAAFGCAAGPLLGLPAGFSAALGLVSVFSGVTNCPVASIFLSVELFGAEGLWCFALACGVSYMLSGYSGLYNSQTILYSKLKAQYVNAHTNDRRIGREAVEEAAAPETAEHT